MNGMSLMSLLIVLNMRIGFLVIDTLSQAIHDGDESSASVGRAVRNAFTVFNY